MEKFAIVLSGLPASGKTTVGKTISRSLYIPYLDKDDFLERLFEEKGIGDFDWRAKLSADSNTIFEQEARKSDRIILISHWQPKGAIGTGTPTAWLNDTYDKIVQINCQCSPQVSASRFISRTRHPGHLDAQRNFEDILKWMQGLTSGYPLESGSVINLETNEQTSYPALIDQLTRILQL